MADTIKERVEELNNAEREGNKAYYAGQRINANPHWANGDDRPLWLAWRRGWRNH